MAKVYSVWLDVEEYDDETEECQSCDQGFVGTAGFPDEDQAAVFAHLLDDIGNTIKVTVDNETISPPVMLAEIGEAIARWQRGRTIAPPVVGFSSGVIIIDEGAASRDGDANKRR